MPTYTRADLEARVNAGIKNKIGLLINRQQTMNDAVRAVNSEFDLRSTRRKCECHEGIFDELLAYPAPVDLKAQKILSISKTANTGEVYYGFNLIPYEQFNQKLGYYNRSDMYDSPEINYGNQRETYTVAFDDLDMIGRMLLAAPQQGSNQIISTLDSLTAGGGLWTSFGDAFNVDTDTNNFVRGNGSINFDINGVGGLTAGIYNATLSPYDLSEKLGNENSVFMYVYFSNVTEVNSVTIRLGNDATNYYQMVVTQTHFNTVFKTGWNLLRFDIPTLTTTGTVDATSMNYIAAFMNKEATKINQTNFGFDNIVIASGINYTVRYYSKYPWQSQAGVWKEQSDESDDFLNADSDEFDLILNKAIYFAGLEVDELQASSAAKADYDSKLMLYKANNPSGALVETVDYQAQYYI